MHTWKIESYAVLASLWSASLCPCLAATAAIPAPPAYETESWPAGRALVWANPGQSGALGDVTQWQDARGQPASEPPDRHTDIFLPPAATLYTVSGNRKNQVRHVTLEANAKLTGGHRNEVEIWGNTWVKPGGLIKYVAAVGDKHTFFRLDDGVFPLPQNGHAYQHPTRRLPEAQQSRTQISHKFQVCKYGTASVEFLGNLGVGDEVMIQHGKLILSGDFRYSGVTSKGAFEIYDGGILELQSGARVAPFHPVNNKHVFNLNIYRNGVLQAGSPERPLTRDAHLLLGFGDNTRPGHTGLYAALGSMVRVYTTDPEKARLVISATLSVPDFHNGSGKLIGKPDTPAAGKNGIALQLAGDVQLDGVHFDYLCEGGLALAQPETRRAWRHVTFGPHCAGPETALVTELSVNPNTYYHGRGDQKSEYNLTVMATASMMSYLAQADPFRLTTLPANTKVVAVGRGGQAIQTPVAVVFEQPIAVTIETKVPGARIRYTTDGTEPTKDSPLYEAPIPLTKTTKLMVKAYKTGVGFSPTFSTTYVFK